MLFTPGPTEIEPQIRDIASMPMPYFRGHEYTSMIQEMTDDAKYLLQTDSTPLTITASGSGAMEMAIVNLTNPNDRVVVLNCGTFGKKWVDMCHAFGVAVKEIPVELGKLPDLSQVADSLTEDCTALFVTAHETSTGLLNDIKAIGEVTRRKNKLLIVDAVSSVGADQLLTDAWQCDCVLVSSQKALACMPGISFVVFSERAWGSMSRVQRHKYYFDAHEYRKNISRGMLPYTPAINVTCQLSARLKMIKAMGLAAYIDGHRQKAATFRKAILSTGMFSSFFAERQSNALTSISLPHYCSMTGIIAYIRENYQWQVAPNPTHDEHYLRVSHMGNITGNDLTLLAEKIAEAANYCKNHNK